MKPRRDSISVGALIVEHLKTTGALVNEDPAWELRPSPHGGLGVFAKRDIPVGDIIFKDYPIILGPRAVITTVPTCVSCYDNRNLTACSRGCGLPVCCKRCEDSSVHLQECAIILKWRDHDEKLEQWDEKLLKCLTPVRALLLSSSQRDLMRVLQCHQGKDHVFEVDTMKNVLNLKVEEDESDFMKLACAVLDANAFEVLVAKGDVQSSLRGLYPLGSLANHNCVPNSTHVFDNNQYMIARAAVFIEKGSEIFHSYSRLIWGTITRRFHLQRTKHFFCRCARCMDPSEFGTYLNAIFCRKCKGMVLPKDMKSRRLEWQCLSCKDNVSQEKVGIVLSVLGSFLETHSNDVDVNRLIPFLKEKLPNIAPDNNEIAVELKHRIVWALGYKEGYLWKELCEEHLILKAKICVEMLNLIQTLGTGQCKLRGLLLYELYRCRKELCERNGHISRQNGVNKPSTYEFEHLLDEAADILRYDVGAPLEVKVRNESNNFSTNL